MSSDDELRHTELKRSLESSKAAGERILRRNDGEIIDSDALIALGNAERLVREYITDVYVTIQESLNVTRRVSHVDASKAIIEQCQSVSGEQSTETPDSLATVLEARLSEHEDLKKRKSALERELTETRRLTETRTQQSMNLRIKSRKLLKEFVLLEQRKAYEHMKTKSTAIPEDMVKLLKALQDMGADLDTASGAAIVRSGERSVALRCVDGVVGVSASAPGEDDFLYSLVFLSKQPVLLREGAGWVFPWAQSLRTDKPNVEEFRMALAGKHISS